MEPLPPPGRVYLVGAGPGDPGLITVRGLELLTTADVVVYDHLASPFLLNQIPPGAERVYAGKRRGETALDQRAIEALLIAHARAGRKVVRLKGGDPFLFGRGGEEALALAEAGVDFEVVPGVTSAFAVPAYAGIPCTHRGLSRSVTVVTGDTEDALEGGEPDLDVAGLPGDTLVLLMGRRHLRRHVAALVAAGRPASTPAALIRWGTTPDQQTVTGTLDTIVELAERRGLEPPVVLVAGPVVALRERLGWWDRRPLFGWRVLVTRAREQARELVLALEERGASTVSLPTIEIVAPSSWAPLDAAIARLERFDWVVFTSANAVRWFFARLEELERDLRDLKGVRIAAIGTTTARVVRERGLRVDRVPDSYRAEGLLEAFDVEGRGVAGLEILIPRAAVAREILPRELERAGARVTVAETYRTESPQVPVATLRGDLAAGRFQLVTFTSSSTVRNFVESLGGAPDLGGARVACIGPLTAETARDLGLDVHIVSPESTITSLVDSIVEAVR